VKLEWEAFDEVEDFPGCLYIPCDYCGAIAGQPCRSVMSQAPRQHPHTQREAAHEAAAGKAAAPSVDETSE
jgi:hypothetical protein